MKLQRLCIFTVDYICCISDAKGSCIFKTDFTCGISDSKGFSIIIIILESSCNCKGSFAIRPAVAKSKATAIAISSVGEEDERWDPTILRIGAEIYDRQGQLIRSLQPRIDQVPCISIDYHQVLDRCNLSRRESLRLTLSGHLHQRVLDGLTTAASGATLVALSYCHAEDTRQNVRRALVGLPQFRHVLLSDDRISNRGKLRVLERLISERCLSRWKGLSHRRQLGGT